MTDEIHQLFCERTVNTISDELAELFIDKEIIRALKRGDTRLAIEALEAGTLSSRVQPHLATLLSSHSGQDYQIIIKVRDGVHHKRSHDFKGKEADTSIKIGSYVAYWIEHGMMQKYAIAKAASFHEVTKDKARSCYRYYKKIVQVREDDSTAYLDQ